MIGMKPKDPIKLNTVPLDKTYPGDGLHVVLQVDKGIYTTHPQVVTKKDEQQTSFGAKICID